MLEDPRELLARAWPPLMPLPPKALRLVELGVLRGTLWFPTRSPPRFMFPALAPPRLETSRVPALGPAPRLPMSRVPALGP